MKPTVVVMPGDGIGRVVIPAALRVLDAVGFEARYLEAEIGWECWVNQGQALPARTVSLLKEHGLGLLGAVSSKPKEIAQAALSPALRSRKLSYFSPVLALRQALELETCIRPSRTLAGNPLNFVRRAHGELEEPAIDVTVVMQNTECLYSGVEWTGLPPDLRAALDRHPQMARWAETSSEEIALSCRLMSRGACRRIARAAFLHARARGKTEVTLCDKWGVMGETGALLLEQAQAVAAEFPEISLTTTNVDAQVMWLTRRPERFQVVLASALLGDILSDGFAGLVGGLGFAHSANIGERCAVFEPTHGSAPRYAELEPAIVNPCAAILAGAMLLDHVGEQARASAVRRAVERVVREGKVRTFDLAGVPGGPQALSAGAASLDQMTDAIIEALEVA